MGVTLIVMFLTTSCSSTYQTMKEPYSAVKFTKDDFLLSEQLSADATTVRVLGIDWVRLFSKKSGILEDQSSSINAAEIPVIGAFAVDRSKNYALFNLMNQNSGYDVVFYPQFKTKVRRPFLGLGCILKITNVQATARLGRVKDDSGVIWQAQQQSRRVEQTQSAAANQRNNNSNRGANTNTNTNANTVSNSSSSVSTNINESPEVKPVEAERRSVEVSDPNQPSKPVDGEKAYNDYIVKNRKPISSLENCARNGKVILSFNVNTYGRPEDIYVLRSLCAAADKEAVRLLQSGPNWTISNRSARFEIDF